MGLSFILLLLLGSFSLAVASRNTTAGNGESCVSDLVCTVFVCSVEIQWPSMSSDLNPIEHIWVILKRQVEHPSPSSIQSLKEVILEEWKKIDLTKCRQLVYSMPRRLGAVIKNHGGHTKY